MQAALSVSNQVTNYTAFANNNVIGSAIAWYSIIRRNENHFNYSLY